MPSLCHTVHLGSFTLCWVGLQSGLEIDEHLFERAVDWLRLIVVGGEIFSLLENVCPTPLEVAAESRIRRPSIANDCSREVLAQDFCGNITSLCFSDGIQRVLGCSKCPDPHLHIFPFDAGFVNVDDSSVLNLFVLPATGARSALDRVPRGRACQYQWSCSKGSANFRYGSR
jgi:hypothetical protein